MRNAYNETPLKVRQISYLKIFWLKTDQNSTKKKSLNI